MFRPILVKFVLGGAAIAILLMLFTEATLVSSIVTALAFSALGFLVGDLLILPRTNNTIATLADFGLAFAFFWFAASMADWELTFIELLMLSVAVGIVEWVVHRLFAREGRGAS